MKYIVAFFRFWYDFIVGDDWTIAAGIVPVAVVVKITADHNVNAWWLLPLVVPVLLTMSLLSAARKAKPVRPDS